MHSSTTVEQIRSALDIPCYRDERDEEDHPNAVDKAEWNARHRRASAAFEWVEILLTCGAWVKGAVTVEASQRIHNHLNGVSTTPRAVDVVTYVPEGIQKTVEVETVALGAIARFRSNPWRQECYLDTWWDAEPTRLPADGAAA
jgi:hypothetical protein